MTEGPMLVLGATGGQGGADLNGPGYRVDLPTLHAAHPEISWTRFDTWAAHTFGATT